MQEKKQQKKLSTRIQSVFWPSYTRLFIKGDHVNWSLTWDAIELGRLCRKLGINVIEGKPKGLMKKQCFFNMSRYELLQNWRKPKHRLAFPYYHGNPSTDEGSRNMLQTIKRHHTEIDRIQVSCKFMENVILDTGVASDKVFRIPIGINMNYFSPVTKEKKTSARKELGIPMNAMVIGSFQKDGSGWKEGLIPKMVKGPDIFLRAIEILNNSVPELFVLLTGPARGYVRQGLEKMKVPYVHRYINDYRNISQYYHALDAYIISSRDEGGPKAVLESMVCGIPLISTKVGQATDLIRHSENGFLTDIENAEALAHFTLQVLEDSQLRPDIIQQGFITAKANDYDNQLPKWNAFMSGFIKY
ncbi:glycosyltransferase family 4 protein [Prosthecochloris marina]|nr:glycosyltransferase family 4 protein [Prosthecochloris marina]